jgi:hypothetical protein
VVRRAEGTTGEEGGALGEKPGDGVELGDVEGLGEGEGRQERGEATGEHRLPRSRRAHRQHVVLRTPARSGYSPSLDGPSWGSSA